MYFFETEKKAHIIVILCHYSSFDSESKILEVYSEIVKNFVDIVPSLYENINPQIF